MVAEKEEEKREKGLLETKLCVMRGKMKHYQAKNESVRELKRAITELATNRKLSDRSDRRFQRRVWFRCKFHVLL